jgi:ElaB/YqjD/DUF883 family membrane-anchored ribosome-binding protein
MAFEEEQHNEVRTEIELLKRDVSGLTQVIDKLDVTIDKLAEVSNGLNRMISVHEEQITRQDQADKELFQLIEMRRVETQEQYDNLHKKMSSQKADLEGQVEKVYEDCINEIKGLRQDSEEQHNAMLSRLNEIEKWKWFIVGIATAVGFVIAQLPWVTSFIG